MNKGHIIFLNGTSSSGKTTIAKALQEKLAEPYMYVSVDECVTRIIQAINNRSQEHAFDKLAAKFMDSENGVSRPAVD